MMAESTTKSTTKKAAAKATEVTGAKPAAKKAVAATTKEAATKPVASAKKPAAPKAAPAAKKPAASKASATPKSTAAKAQTKAIVVSDEQRYRMVAEAAYYRAESNQFKSDPLRDWIEAEKDINALLSGAH